MTVTMTTHVGDGGYATLNTHSLSRAVCLGAGAFVNIKKKKIKMTNMRLTIVTAPSDTLKP